MFEYSKESNIDTKLMLFSKLIESDLLENVILAMAKIRKHKIKWIGLDGWIKTIQETIQERE